MTSKINPVQENVALSSQTSIDSNQQPDTTIAKTSQVFLDATSSDDELPEDSEELIIFKRLLRMRANAMTISCQDQNIKGSELIEIAHNSVHNVYKELVNLACEYEKDIGGALISPPDEENGIVRISAPKDWFMSLGGWKGMMPSEEIPYYFLCEFRDKKEKFKGVKIYESEVFLLIDHRIHVPQEFSIKGFDITKHWKRGANQWIQESGKTDLSYSQIIDAIDLIKREFTLNDPQIAKLQLWALNQEEEVEEEDLPTFFQNLPQENQEEILTFLNYLNGLMFGVETSGLNAALATSLMTLELIVGGRLRYQEAFKANKDGGFYPYACFGDNQGTYNAREEILLHPKKKPDDSEENFDDFKENIPHLSMQKFRTPPHPSPVAAKEAILIKTWLQHRDILQDNLAYTVQKEKIVKAIEELIYAYLPP